MMTTQLNEFTPEELADYGCEIAKGVAFDAVLELWRRREAEGMKQTDLADALGWDPARVRRTLHGPGNWTMKTLGALVQGLRGEMEIKVVALEDPLPVRLNYHAYVDYPPLKLAAPNTGTSRQSSASGVVPQDLIASVYRQAAPAISD